MLSMFNFNTKQKHSNLMKNEIIDSKKIVQVPS